jgi:hypothetical protein
MARWFAGASLESASRRPTPAQKDLPSSKKKEVLADLNGGLLRRHLDVNKTLNMARERYYWLHVSSDAERWCQLYDICVARQGPKPGEGPAAPA